jgi:fluoride exporter
MKDNILIFIGGGLGSVVRFAIGKWASSLHNYHFPHGTLMANVLACTILGAVIGLADHKQIISAQAKLFWAVGFCGGFSTFSTFSAETISLIQNGLPLSSLLYVVVSVVLCITTTFLGMYMVKFI